VRRGAAVCAGAALLAAGLAAGQAITINTTTGAVSNGASMHSAIDRRYSQIEPTHVALTNTSMDEKTRLLLIRQLVAEHGFAMRPFPLGHQGLTLAANGLLAPAGEEYLRMITEEGTSAKPGDRLVLTDVKIDSRKIVFLLNGGPDLKHRFLRNIEIGPTPDYGTSVIRDDGKEPVGSRLTLTFGGQIPELTSAEVKALLAPLISFDVKTPVQAFTDTLPATLKDAILNHRVMVGMTTDMVLFAKGAPQTKMREMDGQIPFEEWIYGKPPDEVDFVRINGNRVIRVEIARMGEAMEVFTRDEVSGLLLTDGTPVVTEQPKMRPVEIGDVQRNPDREAPTAPPSLRKPGETVAQPGNGREMKPVQFPKQQPDAQPGANPDAAPDAAGQPASGQGTAGGAAVPANPPPPGGSQPH
jgi:hypothetical protein